MASIIFPAFLQGVRDGAIHLESSPLYCCLMSKDYRPDAGSRFLSDVIADEVKGPGYLTGGKALPNVRITFACVESLPASWESTAIETHGAIIYQRVTDASNSPLICWQDFGRVKKTEEGEPVRIKWPDGIILHVAYGSS